MIAAALELEVDAYLEQLRDARDEKGRALVGRNGRTRERKVTVGAGTIAIRAPRVHDRRPRQCFSSQILPPTCVDPPPWTKPCRPFTCAVSPPGTSEGLAALVGPEGAALSMATITRLLQTWQEEYTAWRQRSQAGTDYVYVWADGLYFNVRLEEDRLACLVFMGVRLDGKKEVIAIEDGYRESAASWAVCCAI